MIYGPEKLNDHLNDQLSETPKLSVIIKLLQKEAWESFHNIDELINGHFLDKLKNNPTLATKILEIINWLNTQDLTPELKNLKNCINQILSQNDWNNSQKNQK